MAFQIAVLMTKQVVIGKFQGRSNRLESRASLAFAEHQAIKYIKNTFNMVDGL
jgi:hypothetical protein